MYFSIRFILKYTDKILTFPEHSVSDTNTCDTRPGSSLVPSNIEWQVSWLGNPRTFSHVWIDL